MVGNVVVLNVNDNRVSGIFRDCIMEMVLNLGVLYFGLVWLLIIKWVEMR